MEFIQTAIPGVWILEPPVFSDERGFFFESFSLAALKAHGIEFVPMQENCAYSKKKGTVRGIHFQNDPAAQAKIVRCTLGSVLDIAVDLRRGSPTYLKSVSVVLTAENKRQFFIPRGFGHGVISLEDNSMIEYYADNLYSPGHDRSIYCDDLQIAVDWMIPERILSEKDRNAPCLKDSDCNFVW